MAQPYSYDTLAGGEPIFLLEIEFASRTFRFSTTPITMETAAGDEIAYSGGLTDFSMEENSQIIGVDVESNSASVSLVFEGIDLLKKWRQGHVLEGAPAVVSYVIRKNGSILQNMENRFILLTGAVQNPEFGDPDEPLGFCALSVEQRPYDTSTGGLILDDGDEIDLGAFPQADDSAIGKRFPLVIAPDIGIYVNNSGVPGEVYSVPGYCTYKRDTGPPSDCFLLIAAGAVEATEVRVRGPFGVTALLPILGPDVATFGNTYSYVRLSATSIYQPTQSGIPIGDVPSKVEWWVSWTQGGIKNPFGPGPLSGGADICLWALLKGGYKVDTGSFDALRPVLNKYQFHGYINKQQTAWDWLQDNILEFLPIEIINGRDGIRAVLAQIYSQPIRPLPVADIVMGPDFFLSSAITTETDTSDMVNDVTLNFALSGFQDSYESTVRVGSDLPVRPTVNSQDIYSELSQNRYGIKAEDIEADFVYNRATAFLIASDHLRKNALPMRSFEITADVRWGFLAAGDIITLTSTLLYLDKTLAVVTSKSWGEGGWDFTLVIEDAPFNTIRAV